MGRCHWRHRSAVVRAASALAAILLLADCSSTPRATRVATAYDWPPARCLASLGRRDVAMTAWSPPAGGRQCRVDGPVQSATVDGIAFRPALRTSCEMLRAWADMAPVVEDLARETLNASVAAVMHRGSYGCRRMTGHGDRMSLHASGRAFDVAGFVLADGRDVVVERDWNGGGPKERFLRAFARAACTRLGVVLTPDSDNDHLDHIHIDIGPWRLCG